MFILASIFADLKSLCEMYYVSEPLAMAKPITPASMIKIQAIYSVNVFADMSPYPTVVTVVTVK